jgi:hypothetical protein
MGTLSASDVTITDCTVTQFAGSFTRLRFRIGAFVTLTNANTLFTASANTGAIKITPVNFASTQFSSLSAVNTNVFDYYVRWVYNFYATSPTPATIATSTPFFMNSLVYSNTGLSGANVAVSFMFTGSGPTDAANDGTVFPTLIRISGQLQPTEQATADRLLIFFNDMVPLNTNNPCYGPASISCRYVGYSIVNTNVDKLTDYSGGDRIEIQTDLTQKFNIYIPVKTVPAKKTFGFLLTTAQIISA